MAMTSKQRLVTALERGTADRLPVTTHHLMPYFLDKYMGGMSNQACFEHFGLDPITWTVPHRPDPAAGEYYDPQQGAIGLPGEPPHLRPTTGASSGRMCRVSATRRHATASSRPRARCTMVLQSNEHTAWVVEHLIKEKRDIDLIGEFVTAPKCDVAGGQPRGGRVRRARRWCAGTSAASTSSASPARWQDACCLVGTQRMIMETYDDPGWVHELLAILQRRKLIFIRVAEGRALRRPASWAAATPPPP